MGADENITEGGAQRQHATHDTTAMEGAESVAIIRLRGGVSILI